MPRIQPPTPLEIAAEINLSAATLGLEDEADVKRAINLALVNVMRRVNEAIDQAASPYDFPFTEDLLREAFPTKSDVEIAEKLEGQIASAQEWMKFDVVMQFLGRLTARQTAGAGNPYRERYQFAKEQRDENKELTLGLIQFVAGQTPEGKAVQEPEHSSIPVSMSVRVRRTY